MQLKFGGSGMFISLNHLLYLHDGFVLQALQVVIRSPSSPFPAIYVAGF